MQRSLLGSIYETHSNVEVGYPLLFFLPDVHVGDTLVFTYHGSTSGSPQVEPWYFYWPEDVCYTYPDGGLHEREYCRILGFGVFHGEIEGFRINVEADTIAYGEMTTLRTVAVDTNGAEVQIDSTALLRFTATPDSLGSFIKANGDTVHSPLSSVRYIDARLGRIKFVANGGQSDSTLPVVITVVQQEDTTKRGTTTLYLKPPIITILLGETKYFRADIVNQRLGIAEFDSVLPPGSLTGVNWHVTPVVGSRLGTYYDHFEGRDSNGVELSGTDRIRLIGRFWFPDTTFQVKVTAHHGIDSTSINISVVKPARLGTTYRTATDVFGQTVNIDSMCIVWGGKYGIPPHFLKGHARKESSSRFPFSPTYVYEPYTTQFNSNVSSRRTTNPYFVTSASMGTPSVPSHSNVQDYSYPTTPRTVWDMIRTYSQLDTLPSPGGILKYGSRTADGAMDFYKVYKRPQEAYNSLQERWKRALDVEHFPDRLAQANNAARESLVVLMKNAWKLKVTDTISLRLDTLMAQTRIASSYGLFQFLYTTAVEKVSYPESTSCVPEVLNRTDTTFALATRRMEQLLKTSLGTAYLRGHDWTRGRLKGLDACFKEIAWKAWNPQRKGYPDEVLQKTKLFKPMR